MRCYFNLIGPTGELLDDEGVEVASVEEARAEALKAIAELRREDAGVQADWNGWQLRIVSEAGDLLSIVRLNAIVHPTGGDKPGGDAAHGDADMPGMNSKKAAPHLLSCATLLGIHWMHLAADIFQLGA